MTSASTLLTAPLLPTAWLLRRAPTVNAQPLGPHTAKFFIDPPLDASNNAIGAPYANWELTICLVASPNTCIDNPKPLCQPNANQNLQTVCTVTYPSCGATDTNCLRADTAYTVVAVGIQPDNTRSLDSNKPTFTMPKFE